MPKPINREEFDRLVQRMDTLETKWKNVWGTPKFRKERAEKGAAARWQKQSK